MTLRERIAEAAENRQRLIDTIGRCESAERLVTGCCEREYRCHHPGQAGGIYQTDECNMTCALFRQRS